MGLFYGMGSLVCGYLCMVLDRQVVMQLGLILIGFSSFLIGPSTFLSVPDKVWIIFVGIGLNSFFGAWLLVPVTPEVIK